MIAIVSLFVVISVSMLVTRVAALILTHTGLAREPARFQARSAFTGVGFTTSEAEKVVNHPVRRRVVLTLMLLGNAGIVTAMSSLMLAFIGDDVLLIYARGKTLEELDERRRGSSGDRAHAEAVAEHDDEVRRDRNG